MKLSFVPKLARKARLVFDRHSNSHMLVYPERGLALNESAAAIAKRCDGTRTVSQIIEEIAIEAGVPNAERASLEKDIVELVDQLAQKGLLEP
jgi:coenzyme PQQ biosynthesis protein PqqD